LNESVRHKKTKKEKRNLSPYTELPKPEEKKKKKKRKQKAQRGSVCDRNVEDRRTKKRK
jgi:hypothetical protein